MYYNKDVFTEEDVKSLDTMLEKGTVAFPWGNVWYNGTFFLANGGELFGEKGNDASAGIRFGADNGGYEAAETMVRLANHPNMYNDTDNLGFRGLRDGSIGACFSGFWGENELRGTLGDKLGIAMLPTVEIGGEQKQMKAPVGSKAIGVNPCSDDQELAMEFAAYLASTEGQKLRYQVNLTIPAATALLSDPLIGSDPLAVAELSTMAYAAVAMHNIPEMSRYWMPMYEFGEKIVSGVINDKNYKAAVDELTVSLNDP
jgi:arabinogalactan oligomer/maltooligosaccharide transport system substrate-binding protein